MAQSKFTSSSKTRGGYGLLRFIGLGIFLLPLISPKPSRALFEPSPPPDTFPAPTHLQLTYNEGTIEIEATEVDGASGYVLYRSDDGPDGDYSYRDSSPFPSFTDSYDPETSGQVYYSMSASGGGQNSAQSVPAGYSDVYLTPIPRTWLLCHAYDPFGPGWMAGASNTVLWTDSDGSGTDDVSVNVYITSTIECPYWSASPADVDDDGRMMSIDELDNVKSFCDSDRGVSYNYANTVLVKEILTSFGGAGGRTYDLGDGSSALIFITEEGYKTSINAYLPNVPSSLGHEIGHASGIVGDYDYPDWLMNAKTYDDEGYPCYRQYVLPSEAEKFEAYH